MNSATTTPTPAPTTSVGELLDRLAVSRPVVLGVWAHPDDESFVAGGILAGASELGGRNVVVTATLGEHGTDDPITHPPAVLAARRHAELGAAARELGAERPTVLGFSDGRCQDVPPALGAHVVGEVVDRVRPDLVVTFGDDGVTGHPDHLAVADWTRRAIRTRGDRTPLLLAAPTTVWSAATIHELHGLDAFWPGHPRVGLGADVSIRLSGHQVDRKLAALAHHASQMGRVVDALGPHGFRELAAVEAYRAGNRAARERLGDPVDAAAPIAA